MYTSHVNKKYLPIYLPTYIISFNNIILEHKFDWKDFPATWGIELTTLAALV